MAPEFDFVSDTSRYESTAGALALSVLVLAIAVLRNILEDKEKAKGQTPPFSFVRRILPEGVYFNLVRDDPEPGNGRANCEAQGLRTASAGDAGAQVSDTAGAAALGDVQLDMDMTNVTNVTNDTNDTNTRASGPQWDCTLGERNALDNAEERAMFRKKMASVESALQGITDNFHAAMVEVKKRRARWEKERAAFIAREKELQGLYWGERHENAGLRAQCAELEAWAKNLEERNDKAEEEKVWMEETHKARVNHVEGTMRWMSKMLKSRELELLDLRDELAKVREEKMADTEAPTADDAAQESGGAADSVAQDSTQTADYELAIVPFPMRRVPCTPESPTPVCARDRSLLREGVLIREALRAHGGGTQVCKWDMVARCLPQSLEAGVTRAAAPRDRVLSRARDAAGPSKIPRPLRDGQSVLAAVPVVGFPDGR
ncbi:hypothetical protein DENSPDRAFT_870508 [Dentipellis sp. KUC8613]|nr:hypothetical protein DENSPDRAFT_870508 [Dentipellis sp. KUC8613]